MIKLSKLQSEIKQHRHTKIYIPLEYLSSLMRGKKSLLSIGLLFYYGYNFYQHKQISLDTLYIVVSLSILYLLSKEFLERTLRKYMTQLINKKG
jgi:hypothetical protein